MKILTTSSDTAQITGGRYHVWATLNGGTASITVKPEFHDAFLTFTDNSLSDGVVQIFDLPTGEVKLTATGSPTVKLEKTYAYDV